MLLRAMPPSSLAIMIAERVLGPDATTADAALSALRAAHERLAAELAPVVGKQGFEATFARCVSKSRSSHPGLEQVWKGDPARLAARLWPFLETLSRDAIRAVGVELIARFFDLMSTFIGAELTLKLLHRAWPDAGIDELGDRRSG